MDICGAGTFGNFKEKWKLEGKFPKFLHRAQGFHDFEVNCCSIQNSLFRNDLVSLMFV